MYFHNNRFFKKQDLFEKKKDICITALKLRSFILRAISYLLLLFLVEQEKQQLLETRLASTERELSSKIEQTRQQLSSRTRELDQLRVESGGRSERLTANHTRELNSEREKALKVCSNYDACLF